MVEQKNKISLVIVRFYPKSKVYNHIKIGYIKINYVSNTSPLWFT
jgi:hypothetical protein